MIIFEKIINELLFLVQKLGQEQPNTSRETRRKEIIITQKSLN